MMVDQKVVSYLINLTFVLWRSEPALDCKFHAIMREFMSRMRPNKLTTYVMVMEKNGKKQLLCLSNKPNAIIVHVKPFAYVFNKENTICDTSTKKMKIRT